MIQSVQRAVAILRSFTESEPELSVTELSQRLGLHKSTVSRLLSTLQAAGFVGQNPETGRYRLGLGLISLAGVALGRLSVRAAAQPYLRELAELTRETVNVSVLDGRESVNVERAFSPQTIRYVGWIGRRLPLHCTASGLVLLASLPASQRGQLLQPPLRAYTAHTVTDPERLAAILEQVARQGYAEVHEQYEEGFSSVAAPIVDHQGQVVAALAISGPTFRMSANTIGQFVPQLLPVTVQISAELGYQAPLAAARNAPT